MDIDRRRFMQASATGALAAGGLAAALTEEVLALPVGIGTDEGVDLIVDGKLPTIEFFLEKYSVDTGTAKAYAEEVETAARIIRQCAGTGRNTSPFEVAAYFLDLSMGLVPDPATGAKFDKRYAQEWPVRANPLIVSFFNATDFGDPAGDTTAWCSAFVNWCLREAARTRQGRTLIGPTRSAASRSFRDWGDRTSTPNVGDIVVFELNKDANHGHVGFFVADAGDHVYCLGGNQGALDGRNNGEVNLKRLAKRSAYWKLHSYRTGPDLANG